MSRFYNLDQAPFNIRSSARAIAAANNGLLFDIGDMSTLYQDDAGTVPVTAVGQPVGKILDKSGNGNHATQSVTASRPTLSARKNVLLATETLATQSVTTIAARYTLSFTGTGSVTLSGAATGTLTGTGAANRVSLTVTPTAGTLTLTVSGVVTKAQLELGGAVGPYQGVNTATDYNTNPALFPKYLKFDGIDDYLNLPYMGLYENCSASVVAGINVLSATGEIVTEANTITGNNPNYRFRQASNTQKHFVYRDDNGIQQLLATTNSPVGNQNIVSFVDSGTLVKIINNNTTVGSSAYSRSSTTLNNTKIGARVISMIDGYINCNLYGLIITKSALTDAQRIKCERFLARKAGVML